MKQACHSWLVFFLNPTTVFEWCVARCECKNAHPKKNLLETVRAQQHDNVYDHLNHIENLHFDNKQDIQKYDHQTL